MNPQLTPITHVGLHQYVSENRAAGSLGWSSTAKVICQSPQYHIPFQQQRTIVGPLMDQLASCSSQCVIHAESACYNHTSLSEFLFPTRRHTMQRAQKNSTFSHSPCLISLSIYKHLTLLWAVSGVFWLLQDSSLIPFPWTYSIGSKSKIITKIRKGFSTCLSNGQPRECAYKIKMKKCVLIYIHQALRTWGQRNPSQVYQDMEIYIIIYL